MSYPAPQDGWRPLFSPHREIYQVEQAGLVVEAHRLYQQAYAAAATPRERAYWQAQTALPYAQPEYRLLLHWAYNTTAGSDEHLRASAALTQALNNHYQNPIGPPQEYGEGLNQLYLALRTIDPEAAADVDPRITERREQEGLDEDPVWLVAGPQVTEQRTTLQQLVPLVEHRAQSLAQDGQTTEALQALENFRAHLGSSPEGAKVDTAALRELYTKLTASHQVPATSTSQPGPATPAATVHNRARQAAPAAEQPAPQATNAAPAAPRPGAANRPPAATTSDSTAPQVSKQDRQAATEAFQRAGQARQSYHYRSALQYLEQARHLDPSRAYLWDHATNVVRADQAAENAGHLMRKGKFQASLASLKEAQRLDPSREELWEKRRDQVNNARQNRQQAGSQAAKPTYPAKPRPTKSTDASPQRANPRTSTSRPSAQDRRGQGR